MHMYEFDIAITFKHQRGGGGGGRFSNPLHAMKHKRQGEENAP